MNQSDQPAAIAADRGVRPLARLLEWCAPAHIPVPHGGIAARTFAEFPEDQAAPQNPGAYWRNSGLLYDRASLDAKDAEIERLRAALRELCDAADETKYPLHGSQWDRLWNAAVAARGVLRPNVQGAAQTARETKEQP